MSVAIPEGMDPQQRELFDAIWALAEKEEFGKLALYLTVLYVPAIIAWWTEWRKGRAETSIYEARISDKDAEINRLAARIKDLENLTLRTKRK